MLVLSRHRGECIIIGDDIVLTIVDIRGDKVRLGFEAPPTTPIHRAELYAKILLQTGQSALGPRAVPPPDRPSPDGQIGGIDASPRHA